MSALVAEASPTVYRDGCGTHLGLRLHQAHGEEPCSECLHREWARRALYGTEAGRRLLAEAIPRRPSPPGLEPVTEEQAELHRTVLEAEVIAWEKSHGSDDGVLEDPVPAGRDAA